MVDLYIAKLRSNGNNHGKSPKAFVSETINILENKIMNAVALPAAPPVSGRVLAMLIPLVM